MRIGIYYSGVLRPETGGGTVFQENLIDEIARVGGRHEVYVFCPVVPENLNREFGSVRFIGHSPGRLRKGLNALTRATVDAWNALFSADLAVPGLLDRALREHHIDLLWFISTETEKVAIPYIATVWDLAHRVHPYFPEVSVTGWKWAERDRHYRELLPQAACIITGTTAGKEEIVRYYQVPDHIVQVVPFPTPQFALASLPVGEQDTGEGSLPMNYLFYPAQYWPHKNHVGLLMALKILRDKFGLDFNLVFTGSDRGNLRYVQERVKELGLEDSVTFFGFVEVSFLKKLYRNAFALVFPTFFGPDNLPPLEAFALGCPVIASKVAGAEEQLGAAALLFEPGNAEEMATRVKELYDSPEKRVEMIRLGRDRAQNWTASEYVEQVFRIADDFESVRRCWSSHEAYVHK